MASIICTTFFFVIYIYEIEGVYLCINKFKEEIQYNFFKRIISNIKRFFGVV